MSKKTMNNKPQAQAQGNYTQFSILLDKKHTFTIFGCVPSDSTLDKIKAVGEFWTAEQKKEYFPQLVKAVNGAMKHNAVLDILDGTDHIAEILKCKEYGTYSYNSTKDTFSNGNKTQFISYLEVVQAVTAMNNADKAKADKAEDFEPLKITGTPKDENGKADFTTLILLHKAIMGKWADRHTVKALELDKLNKEQAKAEQDKEKADKLKNRHSGYRKYANALKDGKDISGSAQQEMLQYFYNIFNEKTGRTGKQAVNPVDKYKDKSNGTEIIVFDFIKTENRRAKSKNMTLTEYSEQSTFNSLINQYINSVKAVGFKYVDKADDLAQPQAQADKDSKQADKPNKDKAPSKPQANRNRNKNKADKAPQAEPQPQPQAEQPTGEQPQEQAKA